MYALYPGAELALLRAQFSDYEVFEVHDPRGRSEFTAVLKQPHRSPGTAVLVRAGSAGELRRVLCAQGAIPAQLVPVQRTGTPWGGGSGAA